MASAFSLERYRRSAPLVRAKAVARGLPAKAVADVVADRSVTLTDLARVVGPRRTLQRRIAAGERLTPEESDRLDRFIATVDLATSVLGDRGTAMQWLSAPKQALDGERPLDLLRTDAGTRIVEAMLEQARHGFAA